MYKFDSLYPSKKSLLTFFALFFITIFAIGGCNNNGGNNSGDNGGGVGDPGPDASACTVSSDPCSSFIPTDTTIQCVLSDTTCVVDLDEVITILQGRNFNVTDSSTLYIEAWGGIGGGSGQTGNISEGGYAQTTTSLMSFEQGSTGRKLYYFLGGAGPNSNAHCGSGGGASTIVTTEDLTLNPASDPTPSLVMLVAGGGGGAAGAKIDGCSSGTGSEGAAGGIAIATTDAEVTGAGSGCNTSSDDACELDDCGDCSGGFNQGQGGGTVGALGGEAQACLCEDSLPTNGNSSVGGLGGRGGNGKDCTSGTGGGTFINAALTFGNGEGGSGGEGNDDKNCTTGGGGGGGGYGGGGGGSRGNDETKGVSGGGGGSFAVISTDTTKLSPATIQTNPCGSNGCVTITFIEDQN